MHLILRARLKPIEEIPEEALCCDKAREAYAQYPGYEVRIFAGSKTKSYCMHCGDEIIAVAMVSAVKNATAIDPRAWDIEEAPEA